MSSLINELLNRDPMDLSKKDLKELAAHFRAEREKWQSKQERKPARTAKPNIDLDALGFDFSKLKK